MRNLLTDSEGRLRTAWRLLVFGALLIVLQAAVALTVAFVVDPRALLRSPLNGSDPAALLAQGVGILVATAVVYIARRWLDRRPFVSLGLTRNRGWMLQIVAGALLGIALQAGIFLTELAMGWLVVDRVGWRGSGGATTGLILLLIVFMAVAWNEELLTRGYLLQNLESGLGTTLAVVISSVVFGFLHIYNDNSSVIASLGVSFAGLLLAAAYLTSRALWLPIGLHLGWNFGEGPVFGFPVSGLDAGGLVSHRVIGPEAITGGAFGPEAGLVSIVAELIGIGVLLLWYRQRRHSGTPTDARRSPDEQLRSR